MNESQPAFRPRNRVAVPRPGAPPQPRPCFRQPGSDIGCGAGPRCSPWQSPASASRSSAVRPAQLRPPFCRRDRRLPSATAYEEKCELAVENSFGTSNQYANAYSDWQHRAQHPNSTAAPRGTLVFYKTSADGHVAISLGNGTVISSSAAGHEIGISPITGWFSPLLGWAPSPW
jgi:hypothetical protein